jgi:hypothetical protein
VPKRSNSPTPPPSTTGTKNEVYFVEESRSDALLHEVRTDHTDVLVASSRLRLRHGAFEAFANERKRRSFGHPLWRSVIG